MIEALELTDRHGAPIQAITLQTDGLHARILSLGACLQDLRLEGVWHPLVLGYANPINYLSNPAYLGAVVGRVANRLSGGAITLDGKRFELDRNERDTTCLHGGRDGFSHQNWQITDHSRNHVTLGHISPHMYMGFPGRLLAKVTYRLNGTSLSITLTANTDAPTVCNMAPHIYFNLDGSPDIARHRLSIAASHVLPVKNGLPVANPVHARSLGVDVSHRADIPKGLDHHYCLSQAPRPLRRVAVLFADTLAMSVDTTEPGLQVYDGSGLSIVDEGLEGRSYRGRAGIALEPHRWIDAPNQPWQRQTRLRPGEVYQAQTVFSFTRGAEATF
ncbi:galactose mutarotase [Aliiroseovarius sp. Z3]|uniref:aldose epimerase family protein n=1 Tax=Aliiroseovarius sp. Z3 TaxID=2811402 RepID=UPI0023B28A1B|nr:aldose epimerase family protein [Aliiroseovarius sp. Z3]MDE9449822.1 galactose mutarotase [Aliiroseovarius sp. Z3]